MQTLCRCVHVHKENKIDSKSRTFKRTRENSKRSGKIHITPWSLTLTVETTATRPGQTADLKQVWGLLKGCLAGNPSAKDCPCRDDSWHLALPWHLWHAGHCSKGIVSTCSVQCSVLHPVEKGSRDVLIGTCCPNLRVLSKKRKPA